MITNENPSLNSTAEAIFVSTADEDIVEQCRVREDNIAHEKYQNELIMTLTSENKDLSNEIIRLKKVLDEHGIKA